MELVILLLCGKLDHKLRNIERASLKGYRDGHDYRKLIHIKFYLFIGLLCICKRETWTIICRTLKLYQFGNKFMRDFEFNLSVIIFL